MQKVILLCLLFLGIPLASFGQNGYYRDISLNWNGVNLIPNTGAQVTVCAASAPPLVSPCTTPITLFANSTGTITEPNPITVDSTGAWSLYLPPGQYAYTVTGNGLLAQGPFLFNVSPIITIPGGNGVVALEPKLSDAIQYLSLNGNDNNDGFSWGTAKATLLAAYNTLPAGGGTIFVAGGTIGPIDSGGPIAITKNNVSIVGQGEATNLTYSGTANIFNISGAQFTVDNLAFVSTSSGSRASASIFNLQAGGTLGKLTRLYFSGAASINNGRIFNADLTNSGTGEWKFEDWVIVGGATWSNGVFLRTTTGTVSGFTLKNLICFSGTTMSDALYVFDTGVDTAKMSDLESGCGGVAINTRNSLAGQAPRWIHCDINCRLESDATHPVVKIDDVRDFMYQGQVASALNAFVLNGGNQITVTNTQITNIQQDCVLHGAAPVNVSFAFNILEDCGVATDNTYDYVKISAGAQDFDYSHNNFRQLNAHRAKFGFDLLAGATAQFTFLANDFSQAAIGNGYLNNLATGSNQNFIGNKPSATFLNVFAGSVIDNGGLQLPLVVKSSSYTLAISDSWINVTGTTTITVPHALVGQRWDVFNSGAGTVTLQADSGNINGAANITFGANIGKSVTCDGTNCFAH